MGSGVGLVLKPVAYRESRQGEGLIRYITQNQISLGCFVGLELNHILSDFHDVFDTLFSTSIHWL